jgi:hypothetical protein
MPRTRHIHAADVHGAGRMAVDATLGLVDLVEALHHTILRTPGVFAEPPRGRPGGITGLVYKSIRGVTRLVGGSIDALLGRLVPLLDANVASSAQREAVLAALNGVFGDHLAASGNPLAIPMQWRRDGKILQPSRAALGAALPHAGSKLLLLVHGLCMNDLGWRRNGHDHGAALAVAGGFTPLYLHYNSGLHISHNGRAFAQRIEALLRACPLPVTEVSILAHSMGGLVARSACVQGELAGHAWRRKLRRIVFLGTPHHGAPLERGGHWIDAILEASPYTAAFARLGKVRSAGITDLRHGSMLDEDWQDSRRRLPRIVPLPEGVRCCAIAASLAPERKRESGHAAGDGLVPVASALGRHRDPRRSLSFPAAQQWIGHRLHHLDLLDDARVCARLQRWFAD